MNSLYFVLYFVILLSIIDIAYSQYTTEVGRPGQCNDGFYIETSDQTCTLCSATDPNAESDYSQVDHYGSALGCICKTGYITVEYTCDDRSDGTCPAFSCEACPNSLTSTPDHTMCVPCGASTNGKQTNNNLPNAGTCDCTLDTVKGYPAVVRQTNSNDTIELECEPCKANSGVITEPVTLAGRFYRKDMHTCQQCPDEHMIMTFDPLTGKAESCNCRPGYYIAGDTTIGESYCLPTDSNIADASTNANIPMWLDRETEPTVVPSLTVKHWYPFAATYCEDYYGSGNATSVAACQTMANLCVLGMYSPSAGVCRKFDRIAAARDSDEKQRGITSWHKALPWIKYDPVALPPDVCKSTLFSDNIALDTALDFYLSTYTLNGTWLGFTKLGTDFYFCTLKPPNSYYGGGDGSDTSWQYFANTRTISHQCDLETLIGKETYFYELYIENRNNLLVPVPVRILDELGEPVAMYPGENTCKLTDRLVRRFFLFDSVGGKVNSATPSYLRYARTMSLEMRIQDSQSSKAYVPVLTIEYDGTSRADYISGSTEQEVSYRFAARYTMSLEDFYITLEGFFIFACTMFGFLCMARGHHYLARHKRPITDTAQMFQGYQPGLNIRTFLNGSVIVLHSWVIIFFPFMILLCWYFFVFFKLQNRVSILLPAQVDIWSFGNPYNIFVSMLHILAFFQLTWVVFLIVRQCYADIFFIDWEQPRPKSTRAVSVWRRILAVNEWNEMLTMRRTNINFTLFWIAFFLIGLGLDYNSTQQPNLNDLRPGEANIVLRFANTTWWWLILSFAQWLWRVTLYERYISEPPEQKFTDLCTIAKVSVLVLLEPYYGYYLHCRSPHQFADGTMAELVEMLHQEEAGLTVDRSLDGAPKDVQSFQLFVTADWRLYFDKIYSNFTPSDTSSFGACCNRFLGYDNGSNVGGAGVERTRVPTSAEEGNLRALDELTNFMQQFVDNVFSRVGLRRRIAEPSFFDKLVRSPPSMGLGEQANVLVADYKNEFTSATFLGIEGDLLVCNILLYSLFDLWFESTAVSILLTYLVESAFCIMRSSLGEKALAGKTLIDQRFLI